MIGLTTRQRAVLDTIVSLTRSGHGAPPTLRELGAALGIRSTNGVNDHLRALERKGYVGRREQKSRGIFVTMPVPENVDLAAPLMSESEAISALRLAYRVVVRGEVAATYDLRRALMSLYSSHPRLAALLETA